MKLLVSLIYLAFVVVTRADMSPRDIQGSLATCPSFETLEEPEAPLLLGRLIEIAKCDNKTIRQGLLDYDNFVFSHDRKQAFKWYYNQRVLFALLFEFPRGPVKATPFSRIGFIRVDREMDPNEEIEYSLPIEVGADGIVRLSYRFGGYEGRGPWKGESVEIFDNLQNKFKRREIDFSKQPKSNT